MSPGAQPTSPASADAGSPLGANSADQAAVRRALQAALACAAGASRNLDDDARAACRKRLIEGAAAMGEAKVDTIPPLKRAYYDAVQKAYQDFRSFPTPDTELTHLPGAEGMYDQRVASMPGRPGGVGCGLKFGGPNSPHLKIGPITCAVILPASPLNPEVDLPHADQIPGK